MDFANVKIIQASLSVARDVGKALVQLRDWNLVAEQVTKLNDQLLDAQERLFSLSGDLLVLQQEHLEMAEKLRKAVEALAERGRYTLVQISPGQWAYRLNVGPEGSGATDPGGAQPTHYVCQQCFDSGRKVVLQRDDFYGHAQVICNGCKVQLAFSLD